MAPPDPTQPTDRLVDAVTAIVAAKWGPCDNYECEADRGDASDCTAARSTVADVLEALGRTPYGVLLDVAAEMDAQDRKWGQQDHPDGTGRPGDAEMATLDRAKCKANGPGEDNWRDILQEEVSEAFAETDPAKLRAEVIQFTAVGAQWVGSIDRRGARERCMTTTHLDAPCGPYCILAATPARVPYAELTTEPDGTLTADSTITVRSADGIRCASVPIPERHSGGGILAPRRIAEALAKVGYRQVDDWGPVVNGRCRANVEQVEPADDEVCGEAYDHDLRPISERDGACTYECRRCGAEVISETADNA